ncbi:TenA family transcriptional regulator [Neobacillus bataviensis LMG 21833]|uniref:Aminopyrimidine aminohydrolase n=1 Tax=Neobacillus bataviensis LMG 21833 TaxID=1117379 RepID=K6DRF3_9BACI|nr:thiaminase II [Neobacillus bataviensis]EKN70803.1 TenA family transcriptional regulator [Neobacillus bataviensis LMG 21833]
MKFSHRLYEKVREIWEKTHQHPFVDGLGKGNLPVESFIRYMKQDYIFLIDYSKLFALGAVKASNLETMAAFAKLLHETLHGEMELHRGYAAKFGISQQQLEETKPTPTNLAYTRYMLNVAQNGELAELITALLPCMWSYWEISRMLANKYPEASKHSLYGDWIKMYASDEFGSLATWLIELLDQLTEGKPERELAALEGHFLTASRFEYMFWDMIYEGEDWPV